MAVEVSAQEYLFRPKTEIDIASVDAEGDNSDLSTTPTPKCLRFNPLHDAESVWWIAVWVLLNHSPVNHPLASCVPQYQQASDIFEHRDIRQNFFTNDGNLVEACKILPPQFHVFTSRLNGFRTLLIAAYIRAESTIGTIEEAAFEFHQACSKWLSSAYQKTPDVLIRFLDASTMNKIMNPTLPPQSPSSRKRKTSPERRERDVSSAKKRATSGRDQPLPRRSRHNSSGARSRRTSGRSKKSTNQQ